MLSQPILHVDSADVIRACWAPVTIRVAWELHRAGLSPRGDTLFEAREHALLSLPCDVEPNQAESLASLFTREYIERVRHRRYRRRMDLQVRFEPRHRWRERLEYVLDPLGQWVFRMAYGDEAPLKRVAEIAGKDLAIIQSSQQGVRGALRSILQADAISLAHVDLRQLDDLLVGLASLPAPDCQGGHEAVEAARRSHVERCCRCARASRLVRGGHLSPADLVPPGGTEPIARSHTTVLALHLHPDARHHRDTLHARLGHPGIRADADTLLLHPAQAPDLNDALWEAAGRGSPPRQFIRGAQVQGPGRWSHGVLLGPVAVAAAELTRSRQWGEIDTVGPLPRPLPVAPSAGRWWSVALLLALLASLGGFLVIGRSGEAPAFPLKASFARSEGWVAARFDVPDAAWLVAVVEGDGGLEVVHRSQRPSDKGELATGVGDYQLRWPGKRLLLATVPQVPRELQPLVSRSARSDERLLDFAARLQVRYPGTDVRLQEPLEFVPRDIGE